MSVLKFILGSEDVQNAQERLCDHSDLEELCIICAGDNQSAGGVCGELHRESFFRGSDMGTQCEACRQGSHHLM